MQKKFYLQRNLGKSGGGSSPLLKYLVLAVVGLTLLVLITPHLLKPKGKARGLLSEKASIVKELPKPPEQASSETPPEMVQSAAPAPGLAKQPEREAMSAGAPAVEKQSTAASSAEKEQSPGAKLAEPPALFPKSGNPSASVVSQKPPAAQPPAVSEQKAYKPELTAAAPSAANAGGKPGAAELDPGSQPAVAKAAAPGKQMYAVQVGSFKEKQSAEDIQRSLLKRGYEVILCPSAASGGGSYAYTVMTKPVDTVGKAATLVEQLKNEQQVSPTIIKMPPVCEMSGKQPVRKAQAEKAGQAKP